MSNVKKILAFVLCFIVLITSAIIPADASSESDGINFTLTTTRVVNARGNVKQVHASTIVKLDDGSLMCAWYGGKKEGNSDVRIYYSICNNGIWSEANKIPDDENVAHWNPVLQRIDNGARLYYKVGKDTEDWITMVSEYNLSTKEWSEPKELVPGDNSGGRGPVRNKCLLTTDGLLIAPASLENVSPNVCFFDLSEDGGITWTRTKNISILRKFKITFIDTVKNADEMVDDVLTNTPILSGKDDILIDMIQPTLWQDKDGGVHAMFRTDAGYIYRSDSNDGGYTWGMAYQTKLPNNNSGIDCVTTDNGWLWLCYNPISSKNISFRYELCLAVSKDNGDTWEKVVTLEKGSIFSEYSYPAIIADGNSLYITYTWGTGGLFNGKRTAIKCATIDFEEQ